MHTTGSRINHTPCPIDLFTIINLILNQSNFIYLHHLQDSMKFFWWKRYHQTPDDIWHLVFSFPSVIDKFLQCAVLPQSQFLYLYSVIHLFWLSPLMCAFMIVLVTSASNYPMCFQELSWINVTWFLAWRSFETFRKKSVLMPVRLYFLTQFGLSEDF